MPRDRCPTRTLLATQLMPRAARSRVQAFSTGLLSAFGHNPKIAIRDLQGEVQFVATGTTLEDAQLRLKISADSLRVIDDISDKDRREIQRQMYDEVLEVGRFPEIHYDCSRVTVSGSGDRYWAALNGELTVAWRDSSFARLSQSGHYRRHSAGVGRVRGAGRANTGSPRLPSREERSS